MKKILVVGGGAYQVPLIKRIRELGHEAYCIDGNPNAVGASSATAFSRIDVLDKEACLAHAKALGIDAVMTYGATLTLPTVAYIGEKMGLVTLSHDTAELSRSKFAIKQRLADCGCHIKGDFFALHTPEDVTDHTFTFPCVIKPSDGSGSKGVSLVYEEAQLEEAVRYAFAGARYGEIYVESLVEGEEYSAEAFVANGEIYVYAIVKTTFYRREDGEIVYGHRAPSGLEPAAETRIADEVKRAIRALGITMASVNFDVILATDDGEPYIIDCGIRIGQNLIASHFVPLSRGVSVIDNTIGLALGEAVDAAPKKNKCIATRLLIYRPGVIREIRPMDDVIGQDGVIDVVLRKGVGDTLPEYREKSDTCGWVIATGATPDEAEQNAARAKTRLESYILFEREGETKA